jgi:hypothetical protein
VEKIAFIARAKPTTVSNLSSLFSGVKKWSNERINEVFKLIEVNESQLIIENDPAPIQPVTRRNIHVPDYCSEISDCDSDWSVEDMVVEVENEIPPPPPPALPPPALPPLPTQASPVVPVPQNSLNLKVLTGKNRQNVLKKMRLWGNRLKRNQERVEQGLIPIRYYKNKGNKHKIRQAERRERKIQLQRALYSDSFC